MFVSKRLGSMILLSVILLAVPAGAAPWRVDKTHTEVNFSVNHFFTPVTGSFGDFDVNLDYDAQDPSKTRIEAKIKVASIDTGNKKRDQHLRSADWFETEKYPYMTFQSTSVRQEGDQLIARGNLTIKGQIQEVELTIALLGIQEIPDQIRSKLGGTKEVASFRGTTSVARGDYGVGVGNWAATMIVGGDVAVDILLEAHRK